MVFFIIKAIDKSGVIALSLKRGTNKADDFALFLDCIAEKIEEKRAYSKETSLLFFDNARIHLAKVAKETL